MSANEVGGFEVQLDRGIIEIPLFFFKCPNKQILVGVLIRYLIFLTPTILDGGEVGIKIIPP